MTIPAAKQRRSSSPVVSSLGTRRQSWLGDLQKPSRAVMDKNFSSTKSPFMNAAPARTSTTLLSQQDGDCLESTGPSQKIKVCPKPLLLSKQQNGPEDEATFQSVQVVCRFRPLREEEPFEWYKAVEDSGAVSVNTSERTLNFAFDRVFGSQATQADVYGSVRHVVLGLLDGFNGTILAYGQTGSGKTYTMMGRPEKRTNPVYGRPESPRPSTGHSEGVGFIPRVVDDLFAMVEEFQDTIEFTICVSCVEVYCEKVRDLLNPSRSADLKLRDDPYGGVVVMGATEIFVESQAEMHSVIEAGQLGRVTAATGMNEESSRSHALLLVKVTQKNTETEHIRRGKLVMVDLAGSERIAKTRAEGLRLEEAKNINRSLTTLGMVISALVDGAPHVPYRDAKLTRLLAESLGGNSNTCLIVCCAPELSHSQESISTLRFGERAKKVKNHAVRNEELSIYELREQLRCALGEIERLNAALTGTTQEDKEGSQRVPVVGSDAGQCTPPAKEDALRALVSADRPLQVATDEVFPHPATPVSIVPLLAGEQCHSQSAAFPGGEAEPTPSPSSALDNKAGRVEGKESSLAPFMASSFATGAYSSFGNSESRGELTASEAHSSKLLAFLIESEREKDELRGRNQELSARILEEETAVARVLEEQEALQTRLGEAEACLNQMMRAMGKVSQGPARSESLRADGRGHIGEGVNGASSPPEEVSEREQGKHTKSLGVSPAVQDDESVNHSTSVSGPMSPNLEQIYEEKLLSVERVRVEAGESGQVGN